MRYKYVDFYFTMLSFINYLINSLISRLSFYAILLSKYAIQIKFKTHSPVLMNPFIDVHW